LNPGYAKGHSLLGLTLLLSGKPAEAEKAYRDAIRLDPDDAESHYMLAGMLRVQELPGQTGEVEKELREAVRLKPDFAEAYVVLGRCLQDRADSGAVRAYEEAVRLKPYLITVHFDLWDEYRKYGKVDEAKGKYLLILQDSKFSTFQERSTAIFGLATFYGKAKKKEMQVYLKQALELPNLPPDVIEEIKEGLSK